MILRVEMMLEEWYCQVRFLYGDILTINFDDMSLLSQLNLLNRSFWIACSKLYAFWKPQTQRLYAGTTGCLWVHKTGSLSAIKAAACQNKSINFLWYDSQMFYLCPVWYQCPFPLCDMIQWAGQWEVGIRGIL